MIVARSSAYAVKLIVSLMYQMCIQFILIVASVIIVQEY